jgi:hypothetical protein
MISPSERNIINIPKKKKRAYKLELQWVAMENFYVRCVLIDQGSSCDIMRTSLFYSLIISKKDLLPYNGCNLHGFKRASTQSWMYVELLAACVVNTVKAQFLVVDFPSMYNCIIGRPTSTKPCVVSSIVHLKICYHEDRDMVGTVNADLKACCSDFLASLKKYKEDLKG